jgi:aminoglycoside phosphotransferase (APT) family kinase protein
MTEVPGLDLPRLAAYLESVLEVPAVAPLQARLLAGGKSNLTYEVTDGVQTWVVRRPPLGHVLATAHDMSREHRVMTALQDTDVRVPMTFGLCADTQVLGAPFYVMGMVDGTAYRDARQLEALGPDRTRTISTRMVDTLAALHRVDPQAVGLSDFGRPDGFLERQVSRWKKQLDASHSRDLAGAEELYGGLLARVPTESPAGIVHGDYRLDNLLVDDEDQVAAVIDWEMATVGDPLTDVALLVAYGRRARFDDAMGGPDAARAPGFLAGDKLLERYARGSDRDLSAMAFYLGLAFFKSAVIREGIHYRYIHGQTVGDGFDRVGASVEPLIEAGLTALKESY